MTEHQRDLVAMASVLASPDAQYMSLESIAKRFKEARKKVEEYEIREISRNEGENEKRN